MQSEIVEDRLLLLGMTNADGKLTNKGKQEAIKTLFTDREIRTQTINVLIKEGLTKKEIEKFFIEHANKYSD
jgi:hypothetical protein